jgi:FkbM family methyltransferase
MPDTSSDGTGHGSSAPLCSIGGQSVTFISYAQNLEDVMLFRALKDVEKGFYIDAGAQDPVVDSVTKAFYERGWRGINIEPVERWFQKLVTDRPEDINLQVAAAAQSSEIRFFEVHDTGLSTADPEFALRHAVQGYEVREHHIPAKPLDAICAECGVKEVHFLKIDVEGAEAEVLRGIDLAQVRPWIILVEATEPNSQATTHDKWEPLLTTRGYEFVYFDGLNRYYVAEEHALLKSAFSTPPNYFDAYIPYSEWSTRQRATQLENEREVQARQLENEREVQARQLENEREMQARQLENEREVQARQLASLNNDLTAARRENDALQRQLGDVHNQLTVARQQGDALLKRLNGINAERETLAGNLGRLQEKMQASIQETRALRDRLSTQKRINAMLRHTAETVYRSTSWRVTAPLRLLGRVVWAAKSAAMTGIRRAAQKPKRQLRSLGLRAARQPFFLRCAKLLLAQHTALWSRMKRFVFADRPSAMPVAPSRPAAPTAPVVVPAPMVPSRPTAPAEPVVLPAPMPVLPASALEVLRVFTEARMRHQKTYQGN